MKKKKHAEKNPEYAFFELRELNGKMEVNFQDLFTKDVTLI